jgi:hydrogenase maturation protease
MAKKQITVLGVGNILFMDEGIGVRVVEALEAQFTFPENVKLVDGGVLGMNLLSVISDADHLIVVDAVKNGEKPGSLYRLEDKEIPQRILAKNSLHQIDLLESLTLCQVFEKVPETVILGVEPENIETLCIELTDTIKEKLAPLSDMVLAELTRLGAGYEPRTEVQVKSECL